ncbi:MAG: phosphoribosylanthranilate isomerase [Bradymonadia bacterium]
MGERYAQSLYVKICGLSDEAAVTAAVEAGADAIGLVMVSSPRQVSPLQAAALAAHGRGLARRLGRPLDVVAVFRWADNDTIAEAVEGWWPDAVQVYPPNVESAAHLRHRDPPGRVRRWLPAFRDGATLPTSEQLPGPRVIDGPTEGSGETGDWAAVESAAASAPVILAGGLSPKNVASAIERVRPYGVDVSSGVESSRGQKSPQMIKAFIAAARAAARGHSFDPVSPDQTVHT